MLNPIADLFPETTIMFADIAGFTAWSSEREPGEVFQLLESVYYAFDNVARQMGVFKLETIGDCYVAATGLPEPNKDHAIIMTRFAFECLHQMQETTRKLEITLGPGTSDLDIRVGLHSGPVTGGVLRGEKSRFQLFGDTMNTGKCKQSAKLSCLNMT
jgi:class 3 adenylate cyclase